jgi:hypothetical protein
MARKKSELTEKIIALLESGEKGVIIADMLDCGPRVVYDVKRRFGVQSPPDPYEALDLSSDLDPTSTMTDQIRRLASAYPLMPNKVIAEKVGCRTRYVSIINRKAPAHSHLAREIIKMAKELYAVDVIAGKLSCSKMYVRQVLRQAHIGPPKIVSEAKEMAQAGYRADAIVKATGCSQSYANKLFKEADAEIQARLKLKGLV